MMIDIHGRKIFRLRIVSACHLSTAKPAPDLMKRKEKTKGKVSRNQRENRRFHACRESEGV